MERNGHIKNKYYILENGSCDTENREAYLARLVASSAVVQEKVKMCKPIRCQAAILYFKLLQKDTNNTSLAPPPQRNIYGTFGDWVCGGTLEKNYGIRTDEQTDARYFYFVIVSI